jgi:hypothetical protein
MTVLFIALNVFTPNAEAVQIKKVYRGIANFSDLDLPKTEPIGGQVDPEKTLLLISAAAANATNNSYGERNFFFTAELLGNDKIKIDRGASHVEASVAWQVIEFADGVRVQRGAASLDKGMLSKSITLPPLSPAVEIEKSVPIVTMNTLTGGNSATSFVRTHEFFVDAALSQSSGSTVLTLKRGKASATANDQTLNLAWQIVEFGYDARVYSGFVTMPVPQLNGTQSVTNDGLDPDGSGALPPNAGAFNPPLANGGANALLFFYPKYGTGFAGEDARIFIRGSITNDTTVTFARGYGVTAANTDIGIRYYVVDFTDGSGAAGDLGKGLKGALSSASESALKSINKSTNKSPMVNTTSAGHGFAAGDLINVGGVNKNTAANGTWRVGTASLTATTFTMEHLTGAQANGAGGQDGTSGKAAKANEVNLTALYSTIDPSRFIALSYTSAASSVTNATNHWADDLMFLSHLYQKGNVWYYAALRNSGGRAIAADVDYFAYEFPSLTLKNPNGGGYSLIVDSEQMIAWSHSESAKDHDWQLEVSMDGGASYTPMTDSKFGRCGPKFDKGCTKAATGVPMTAGMVPWKVSDSVGNNVKIRIMDVTDSSTPDPACKRRCDASNLPFAIQGMIKDVYVKSAGAASTMLSVESEDAQIVWTQVGSLGTVTIDMDLDGDTKFGADDEPDDLVLAKGFVTGGSGPYSWNWTEIGEQAAENHVIRVLAETDPAIKGFSGPFSIRPAITILEPLAGAKWYLGKLHTIRYCTTGPVGNVKVYLSANSGSSYDYRLDSAAVSGVPATRSLGPTANCKKNEAHLDWLIDSSMPEGAKNKIKIEKWDMADVNDTAPDPGVTGAFQILKPSFVITSPLPNDIMKEGEVKPITWAMEGQPSPFNMTIKYTKTWSTCQMKPGTDPCWLAIETPSGASVKSDASPFSWMLKNVFGMDIGIRVQDASDTDKLYDKKGPFMAAPADIPPAVIAEVQKITSVFVPFSPPISTSISAPPVTSGSSITGLQPQVSPMPHESMEQGAVDLLKNPLPGTVQTPKGFPSRMDAAGRTPSSAFQRALEQRKEFLKKILASHEIRNNEETAKSASEPDSAEQEEALEEAKDEEMVTRMLSGEVSAVSPAEITIVYDRIASIGLALKMSFPMNAGVKLAGYGTLSDIRLDDRVTVTYDEVSSKDVKTLTAIAFNKRPAVKAAAPAVPAAPAQ